MWSEDVQAVSDTRHRSYSMVPASSRLSGQRFVLEIANADRSTMPYLHHFITFCCRFLVYPNDSEGNPFQDQLVPLAVSSPALLHSMTAVAAGHLMRSQAQHEIPARKAYNLALRELNAALSDPCIARSDGTLGACLLLCVYEVCKLTSHTLLSRC